MKLTRPRTLGVAVAFGASILASSALAQSYSERQMEQHILRKMHDVNRAEMRMGEMAMRRGHSQAVRSYGRRLRSDHQANDRMVRTVARSQGVTLVEPMPMTRAERIQMDRDQQRHDEVMSARGREFDRAFTRVMAEGHADVARMLRHDRNRLHRGRVRALVNTTIPAVERHQRLAQRLEDRL